MLHVLDIQMLFLLQRVFFFTNICIHRARPWVYANQNFPPANLGEYYTNKQKLQKWKAALSLPLNVSTATLQRNQNGVTFPIYHRIWSGYKGFPMNELPWQLRQQKKWWQIVKNAKYVPIHYYHFKQLLCTTNTPKDMLAINTFITYSSKSMYINLYNSVAHLHLFRQTSPSIMC